MTDFKCAPTCVSSPLQINTAVPAGHWTRICLIILLILFTSPSRLAADGPEPDYLHSYSGRSAWSSFSNQRHMAIIPLGFSGRLDLLVQGGDGGNSRARFDAILDTITAFGVGGPGASVTVSFSVGPEPDQIPPGSTIQFIRGNKGGSGNESIVFGASVPASESRNGEGGGGGAGSAVYLWRPGQNQWELLAGAGGGGGAYSNIVALVPASGDGRFGRFDGNGGDGAGPGSGDGGVNGEGGGGEDQDVFGLFGAGGGGGTSGRGSGPGGEAAGPYRISDGGWGRGGSGWGAGGATTTSQGGGGGGYSGGGGGGEAGGGGGGGSFCSHDFRSANRSIRAKHAQRQSILPRDGYAGYQLVRGYSVDLTSVQIQDSGGFQRVQVTAIASPADPWTATTTYSWLHPSHVGGQGSQATGFIADANTGPTRFGFISIAGRSLVVRQGGTDVVSRTDDSEFGYGTLRNAIDRAGAGSTIVFDSSLSGATIVLTAGELVLDKDLTFDATALPEGITIDASGGTSGNRVMTIPAGVSATLKGLTLTGGDATTAPVPNGGALLNLGTLQLSDCTIRGNTAAYGGAIYSASEFGFNNLSASKCTFSGNSSTVDGGGIYARGTIMTLDQCILAENTANRTGGGLFKVPISGTSCILTNCSLAGNTATVSVGGVMGGILNNCIVYANNAPVDPNHSEAAFNASCSFPLPAGPDNIADDPQFMAADDFRLLPHSPCIDSGEDSYVASIETDFIGNPRVADGPVDMGVYEEPGPAIYYVSTTGDDEANGYSWATAKRTIQAAVDIVAVGSTIVVDDGVYDTGSRIVAGSLPNRVVINKAITVQSLNGPGGTIIRGTLDPDDTVGDGAVRCAWVGTDAQLIGFTLTNGATRAAGDLHTQQSGGGLWCEGGAEIIDCTITGNFATLLGGGTYGGTLLDCRITNNLAEPRNNGSSNGGGAANGDLTNCRLTGNVADLGGGASGCLMEGCELIGNIARNYGGGVLQGVLNHCVLTGNRAENQDGGGAYQAELNHCVLTGNEAANGGGAYDSTLSNCLVTGCNAVSGGGGAYGGTLNNCTLTGNHATGEGGGVSSANLNNCIVYFNTADGGASNANHFNSSFNHSCTTPSVSGGGNIAGDPQFVNAAGGDFRLLLGSPCVDAGDNGVQTFGPGDLDDNQRIVHCTIDMGAYENQESVITWYVAPGGSDLNNDGSSWANAKATIQAAIDVAVDCDIIMVDDGVYNVGGRTVGVHALPNRIVIDKPLTVISRNGPEHTIIEGVGPVGPVAVRCAYVGVNATLSGFTLRNGATLATQTGAAFFEELGAGGAYCEAGGILENCILSDNSGVSPGAVYGGVLNRCHLINNHATNWGGGARSSTLNNCLLTGNSADLSGGGVYQGTLNNCTLTENSAVNDGGGAAFATLNNCIAYFNLAPLDPNHLVSTLSNSCSVPSPSGAGNIPHDPEFVNPPAGDFRLRATSPCIDLGDNSTAPGPGDLNGRLRITNATVDMGAYESNGGYSLWASGITNGLNGPDDSAVGDGYSNLVKYAAGSSALVPDQLAATRLIKTGGAFQLKFNRDPEAVDVTILVEASSDLGESPWEVIATHQFGTWTSDEVITETGGNPSVVTLEEDAGAIGATRFYRLRVVLP